MLGSNYDRVNPAAASYGSYGSYGDDVENITSLWDHTQHFDVHGSVTMLGAPLAICEGDYFQAAFKWALGHQLHATISTIFIENVTDVTEDDTEDDGPLTMEKLRRQRSGTEADEVVLSYHIVSIEQDDADSIVASLQLVNGDALTSAIVETFRYLGGDASQLDHLLETFQVGEIETITVAPTSSPTASPTDILSTPDPHDFDAGGSYHLGGHLVVADPGTFYTEGEEVLIGAGNPGWTTPAKLVVTSVDEAGGLIDLDVIDGGLYTGDRGIASGDYDLTPVEASLLLKARSSSPATAQTKTKQSDLSASEYRTVGIIGVASSLLALVAIVALVSRRRGAPALHNIVQEAATTPAADTAADAL
jgi:hypothetical protein